MIKWKVFGSLGRTEENHEMSQDSGVPAEI
jgi:hypothetical protein